MSRVAVVVSLLRGGGCWLTPFIKNSETTPLIKVSLEPPPNPYPQVTELRNKLERDRLKEEESLFQGLETAFQHAVDSSKTTCTTIVTNSLKILSDKSILDMVVKGNLDRQPSALRSHLRFEEVLNSNTSQSETTELQDESESPLVVYPPSGGPVVGMFSSLSFLESSRGIVDTVKKKLSNVAMPSVNVQLLDVLSPDISLEAKILQVEQKRRSLESKLFETTRSLFTKLVTIFGDEVRTNLQIQLNAFLVDAKTLQAAVADASKGGGGFMRFLETSEPLEKPPIEALENVYLDDLEQSEKAIFDLSGLPNLAPLSFAELSLDPTQLNLAVGGSDKP